MKNPILTVSLVMVVSIMSFHCSKNEVTTSASSCRPVKLLDSDSNFVATITYTSWGAIESIQVPEPTYDQWSFFFFYDSSRRLIHLIESFSNEGPGYAPNTEWFYRYEGDRIVTDSIAASGGAYAAHGKYEYDSSGRIIRYTYIYEGETYVNERKFSYIKAEDPFKNNHSVFGACPEAMFANFDYNTDNAGVVRRNEYGYPVKISNVINGTASEEGGYWFRSIGFSYIEYECP